MGRRLRSRARPSLFPAFTKWSRHKPRVHLTRPSQSISITQEASSLLSPSLLELEIPSNPLHPIRICQPLASDSESKTHFIGPRLKCGSRTPAPMRSGPEVLHSCQLCRLPPISTLWLPLLFIFEASPPAPHSS